MWGCCNFLLFESYSLFWMAIVFVLMETSFIFEHGILQIYLYGSNDTLQADNPWWVKGFNTIILLLVLWLLIYLPYSGLLSKGKNFMIFANWTQFVNNFQLKLFYLEPHNHEDQTIGKIYLIKCDTIVHLQNIYLSKITRYVVVWLY